jgi:MerR family transcriptional regulator, light-induced transcriptional regulator
MRDGPINTLTWSTDNLPVGAASLAEAVVAKVVARDPKVLPPPSEAILMQLTKAVCAGNPNQIEALKPDLKRARITPQMLADIYIPEAARRLGLYWEEDKVTFADVTIGVARLQAILRDISADWAADDKTDGGLGGAVLLLLAEKEHHTLGPLVLTGQLRRRGVSVCLQLASADSKWKFLLHERHFDGVIISVGWEGKLSATESLIKTLKQLTKGKLPIAVGGAVLTRNSDTIECIGADIVTNDLDKALTLFGLTLDSARASVST